MYLKLIFIVLYWDLILRKDMVSMKLKWVLIQWDLRGITKKSQQIRTDFEFYT